MTSLEALNMSFLANQKESWLTTDLGSIFELLNWGSLLMSVLGDHGSHEDVIRIGGEVWSDNSLILTVSSAILNGLPSVVDWALIDDLVGVDANVGFLIIGLRVRGLGIGLDLNGALVWWSG